MNQALLFEQVRGSAMPLAINTFGSYQRMCLALGCSSFDELAGRIGELTKPEVPTGILNKNPQGHRLPEDWLIPAQGAVGFGRMSGNRPYR